jgi:ABC-type transporter Mla subunit MlaD
MKNVICSVQALEESQNTLLNLFENNAITLNDSLDQLEEWNDYYTTNKPTAECDIKKQNLIIHNMRIRNDYISYLICGMKRIADTQKQIDKLNNNVNEYIEFFQDQFKDLDRANKII